MTKKNQKYTGVEEWDLPADPKDSPQTESMRDKRRMGPPRTKPSTPQKDSHSDKKRMKKS